VRDKLFRLGIAPTTSTPAQLASMVAEDAAKWKKIIVERKITGD
jgi:tripartite-type tricarboxylate transporter receptor subunit TctC